MITLLLSPALLWHWLPGEGGPEAAAAARPRPPGIFERCSWVREGGRRGRGGWAGSPNPPPKKEGASRGGEGGGRHSVWPLRSRPRRTPGAARPRPSPGARQPLGQAAWPGRHVAAPAWLGHSKGPKSRRPGLLEDRGHIVPTPSSAEEQAVASTLAASLKERPGATTPGGPTQSPAANHLTPVAVGPTDRGRSASHPSSPSLSFPSHIRRRQPFPQGGLLGCQDEAESEHCAWHPAGPLSTALRPRRAKGPCGIQAGGQEKRASGLEPALIPPALSNHQYPLVSPELMLATTRTCFCPLPCDLAPHA
uniref:Uncharacterized protein n=1 Tax=Marmota marmota marmota TaxID=9994 RepID=A0A8C6A8R1_MARMA